MLSSLAAVVLEQSADGTWVAVHGPSGRSVSGVSPEAADQAMRELIGMEESGDFAEPSTADRFEGIGREIAEYLEGSVSDMLKLHSGFARLEAYHDGIATIRLGGGCQGCPSSRLTLMQGVRRDLQDKFGEDVIMDVYPVLD